MGNQLQPGIEMDLLIAEHVMGAMWVTHDDEQPEACPYIKTKDWIFYPNVSKKAYPEISSQYAGGMPYYSLLLGPAWKVVDKMFSTHHYEIKSQCEKIFSCQFNEEAPMDELLAVWAESVPEAICLAALKAKGIK